MVGNVGNTQPVPIFKKYTYHSQSRALSPCHHLELKPQQAHVCETILEAVIYSDGDIFFGNIKTVFSHA